MIQIDRIDQDFTRWVDLLALIQASFSYMDGIIDPPSSANLLTMDTVQHKAANELVFVAMTENQMAGCIFCRPEAHNCLYVGKLAVLPHAQGKGLGYRLLEVAQAVALENGFERLRLETRIELTANHATFSRWGFFRTEERSHPGYERVTFVEMIKILETPAIVPR